MRRSSSCLGMRVLKVLIHMQMQWCVHIEDDADDDKKCGVRFVSNGAKGDDRELVMKSRRSSSSSSPSVKVVKWEGGLKTYSRPIKVEEVMMEFPKHMVCRSDSLYIGQKIPPLSNHQILQPGHVYFLLPSHLFHSALSFVSVASILSSRPHANNNFSKKKKKTYNLCSQPFLIQKSPSGCSKMRVSDEFIISHLQYYDDDDDFNHDIDEDINHDDDEEQAAPSVMTTASLNMMSSSLCTTPQLHREYAQLVQSRRTSPWKPKLSTINETTKKTIMRKRRNN